MLSFRSNSVASESLKARPAPRLHFIDGLRGLAMLMVLLFHGWVRNHYWHLYVPLGPHHYVNIASLLSHGYTGVHLFLVLSGFCLFWPFVKGDAGRADPVAICAEALPPHPAPILCRAGPFRRHRPGRVPGHHRAGPQDRIYAGLALAA